MKRKKSNKAKKFFVVSSVMLWLIIILFALYILKSGGHLKPRAAGVEEVASSIFGKVTYNNDVVVGAKITLSKGSINSYTYSDSGGNFSFANVNGRYSLKIEKDGYRTVEAKVSTLDDRFQNFNLNR